MVEILKKFGWDDNSFFLFSYHWRKKKCVINHFMWIQCSIANTVCTRYTLPDWIKFIFICIAFEMRPQLYCSHFSMNCWCQRKLRSLIWHTRTVHSHRSQISLSSFRSLSVSLSNSLSPKIVRRSCVSYTVYVSIIY